MKTDYYDEFRNIRLGLLFSLLTLLFGFGLVVTFGVFEEEIITIFSGKAEKVIESTYDGNALLMKKGIKNAWVQLNNSRLHAFSLGTASLSLCILLAFLSINDNMKAIVAFLLGSGALGYSLFWMWVSIRLPEAGTLVEAKHGIRIVAQLSSGACVLGLISMFLATTQSLFKRHF